MTFEVYPITIIATTLCLAAIIIGLVRPDTMLFVMGSLGLVFSYLWNNIENKMDGN